MSISLYDVSVRSFIQTLGGVATFLDRGLSHFQDNNVDPNAVTEARLFDDMLPFAFQIHSVLHHSIGAIEATKKGESGVPSPMPARTYADMQAAIAEAKAALEKLDPAEINALEGKDMFFQIGPNRLPFTAEGYLMSFALPNLHFHATTAYDILRTKGVPLGKRDYLGPMRMKV